MLTPMPPSHAQEAALHLSNLAAPALSSHHFPFAEGRAVSCPTQAHPAGPNDAIASPQIQPTPLLVCPLGTDRRLVWTSLAWPGQPDTIESWSYPCTSAMSPSSSDKWNAPPVAQRALGRNDPFLRNFCTSTVLYGVDYLVN